MCRGSEAKWGIEIAGYYLLVNKIVWFTFYSYPTSPSTATFFFLGSPKGAGPAGLSAPHPVLVTSYISHIFIPPLPRAEDIRSVVVGVIAGQCPSLVTIKAPR